MIEPKSRNLKVIIRNSFRMIYLHIHNRYIREIRLFGRMSLSGLCAVTARPSSPQCTARNETKRYMRSILLEQCVYRKATFLLYVCKREPLIKEKLNDYLYNHVYKLSFTCTQCNDPNSMNSVRMMIR